MPQKYVPNNSPAHTLVVFLGRSLSGRGLRVANQHQDFFCQNSGQNLYFLMSDWIAYHTGSYGVEFNWGTAGGELFFGRVTARM